MQRIAVIGAGIVGAATAFRLAQQGAQVYSIEPPLDEQVARIRAYCADQGWTVSEMVTDDGVSGGRRERLARLADRVKAKTGPNTSFQT